MRSTFFRLLIGILLSAACLMLIDSPAIAEDGSENVDAIVDTAEAVHDVLDAKNEKRALEARDFVAMPMPISNPTIGTGLAGVVMWIHRFDNKSPRSTATLGGFYTNTESKGIFAVEQAYLAEDKYRLNIAAGAFDMNLKFFGIGNSAGDNGRSIEINQSGGVLRPQFLWRIRENLYLGPLWNYLNVETSFPDLSGIPLPPNFPDLPTIPDIRLVSSGPGVRLEYDARTNRLNPQSGSYLDLSGNWFDDSFGSDRDFTRFTLIFNHYFPMREKDILAIQTTACGIGDQPPFYALCHAGTDKELRGYVGGQYRDKRLFTAQAEYRLSLPKRFGLVFFGGAGQVGKTFGDFTFDNFLPSVGAGLRWMASVEHGVNISIDYAIGKDTDAWYFYIGESF